MVTCGMKRGKQRDCGKLKQYTVNSLLTGHLYKMDTSVKLELVPAFLYSFYLTLYKTDTSLRWTLSAGPKGVRLRES